jgi:hypothetical protein
VSREVLRAARRALLEEGKDWRTDGNRVVLRVEAAEKVAAALMAAAWEKSQGGDTGSADGAEKEAVAEAAAERAEVKLIRVVRRTLNPRLVLGQDGLDVVRIRVRDAGRIRMGIHLACRRVEGDLWEVWGRVPRRCYE